MKEINYIRISASGLLENFHLYSENLVFQKGLRINSTDIYLFKEFIINHPSLDITDLAVDECDTLWLIDRAGDRILSYSRYSGAIMETGCRPGLLPLRLNSPSGLGIDRDTVYISDYNALNKISRIIALARCNLQIRWICSVDGKGNLLSEINDLTAGVDGRIYALEKSNKQVLIIERSGEVSGSFKSDELSEPTDLAVDDKGTVYVLDGAKVFIFRPDGSLKIIQASFPLKGISVSAKKQIFAGEPGPALSKKTIFRIMPDGYAVPIWSYRGAVRKLINDSKGNLYIIDSAGQSIAFLEYATVNTKSSEGIYKGVFISKPADSAEDKNRWHRLLIDGEFPKGSQIEFSYIISNSLIPDNELVSMPEGRWENCFTGASEIQGANKRDALFLEAVQGRYLWFRLTLFGDEKTTPVINNLTIFFPRITLLEYLPAVYQENPAAKDFLERFLSIFESLIYETDFEIKHLTRLFDAGGAPSEFLSWLGSWLSCSVDENWPETKTRAFLEKAVYFYKMRGTRKGLGELLELFTGTKPYIVENLHADFSADKKCPNILNAPTMKDSIFLPPEKAIVKTVDGENIPLREALFGRERFCFCVLLIPSAYRNLKKETIKKIIDEYKPAHTCYGLKALEPWFYLDMHSWLGVNTCLAEPVFVLGESSVIGRDTKLHDNEEAGQAGRRARTGIDTNLT